MKEIIFATGNAHKIEEVNKIISKASFMIKGLKDIGVTEDIPETGTTMKENAKIKADYVYDRYGVDVFSEDSGLEVMALDMEPGIYSARYAGPDKDSTDNISLLLERMKDKEDRRARFRAVICYIRDGNHYYTEGIVNGKIAHEIGGEGGFGYDPIFIPDGYEQTFAELSGEIKNSISHRTQAIQELIKIL